jgi:hypothetical protein
MGFSFQMKQASLVAYITVPWMDQPPRLKVQQVRDFLDGLRFSDELRGPMISSRPGCTQSVRQAAGESLRRLDAAIQRPREVEPGLVNRLHAMNVDPGEVRALLSGREFLPADEIKRVIGPLKPLLGEFSLFGLQCGANKDLSGFVRSKAISSGGHALFLTPEFDSSEGDRSESSQQMFGALDPFPGLARASEQPELWPGVLFWSKSGASAFAPHDDVGRLYEQLESPMERNDVQKIRKILEDYKPPRIRCKTILHLSDLHFGSRYASQNHAYLSARLRSVVPSVDRIVITGDMFDNPDENAANLFEVFRGELIGMTKDGTKPTAIPGNHDQSWMGNKLGPLGRRLEQLAQLEWSRLVVDDELKCLFFCFDSTLAAAIAARGRVSNDQLVDIGTAFEQECAHPHEERRQYLSIALVHHHPFTFNTATTTFIQRSLSLVGLNDETFLRMDDADKFVTWCARRGVSAILQGHKHVARDAVAKVVYEQGGAEREREVRAIGCGASLGMDGGPISYDILTWDERSRTWAVSFYSDPGDGSGFVPESVSLTKV